MCRGGEKTLLNQWRRDKSPPPTPPKKKKRRRCLTTLEMTQWSVTLRSEATKGLLLSFEEVKRPSSNSTRKKRKRFFKGVRGNVSL
jgi:hypothetical protein